MEAATAEMVVSTMGGLDASHDAFPSFAEEEGLDSSPQSLEIARIARCFTYGGSTNQILHDPEILPRQGLSKEAYVKKEGKHTTINHFHEKLFKLKDLMKTKAGKERAERRHKFMQDFLAEFYDEWSGRA